MKQKFLIGSLVYITNKMPSYMSHFDKGVRAIVNHTYSQAYGGNDVKSYSLVLLDKKGHPFSRASWYEEDQLTLLSNDLRKGMEIMENYILKKKSSKRLMDWGEVFEEAMLQRLQQQKG